MGLFLAGAGALLIVATVLMHKLKYPNDTLGLRAARRDAAEKARQQ